MSKKKINQETPQMADFTIAFEKIKYAKSPNTAITLGDYEAIRREMLKSEYAQTRSTVESIDNYAQVLARKEYAGGFDAIEFALRWLWDKYIAGRIKEQFIAEFVFGILLKGVKDGIAALFAALRTKKPDLADTAEDVIDTVGEVISTGSFDDFKDKVTVELDRIKTENAPNTEGVSKKWYSKVWNSIKGLGRLFGIVK